MSIFLNNATHCMFTTVMLMELAYQLWQAGHMLASAHCRQYDNQWGWSDAPKLSRFLRRVDVSHIFLRFFLLPEDRHHFPPVASGAWWAFVALTREHCYIVILLASCGRVGDKGSPLHTRFSFFFIWLIWTWSEIVLEPKLWRNVTSNKIGCCPSLPFPCSWSLRA